MELPSSFTQGPTRMKLHYSPASPYVRKARVVAIETGLMDDIELAAWFEKFGARSSMGETRPE